MHQLHLSRPSTAILLLMGGRSKRMGSDKAVLTLNGNPFWKIIAEELSPCGTVYLSIDQTRDTEALENYPYIRDEIPMAGVMGGLYSAFRSLTEDLIFVCACDMPFMNRHFLTWMLNRWHEEKANGRLWDGMMIYGKNGKIYTTAGLYHRRIQERLEQNVREAHFRMNTLAKEESNMLLIPEQEVEQFRRCFRNINTPEDYDLLLKNHLISVEDVNM